MTARPGWTRERALSGPADTYLGRWQLRRSRKNRRHWVLFDLRDPRMPCSGQWSATSIRAAVPYVERYYGGAAKAAS